VIKPQKPDILNQIISDVLATSAKNRSVAEPSPDEMELLRQYNEVLFRKLERKVKQLEEEVAGHKRAEERILLANRKLSLMTEVTYQDIQNKITALRGFAELSKKYDTEEGRIAYIEKQMVILDTIQNLIKKTKDYQQMGLHRSRWMGQEEIIRMQMSLQSQMHTVSLVCDLHGLEINTDPLIARVFYNLIHNAIRHGVHVTRISISFKEDPDGLILACEDDGVGIPSEEKSHLFDRIVGGEGKFGLFFIRELLTLSGMTIQETGIYGKGARFEITVPRGMYRFAAHP
jgi:signal transduction histidine kinase